MNQEKQIQAMLSAKVVISKGDYINYLLANIIKENETLQHALESDKFHVVGKAAAMMEHHAEALRITLDA